MNSIALSLAFQRTNTISPLLPDVPSNVQQAREDFQFGNIYIAGPMTGYAGLNYEEFFKAEQMLSNYPSIKQRLINPARLDIDEGINPFSPEPNLTIAELQQVYKRDISKLLTCRSVIFLPSWEFSTGSLFEEYTSYMCGIKRYELDLDTEVLFPIMDEPLLLTPESNREMVEE